MPCLAPAPHALQRKTLAAVGAAGRRGALQSHLAAQLGVENRNFFYIVKARLRRLWLKCCGARAGWLTAGRAAAAARLLTTHPPAPPTSTRH